MLRKINEKPLAIANRLTLTVEGEDDPVGQIPGPSNT